MTEESGPQAALCAPERDEIPEAFDDEAPSDSTGNVEADQHSLPTPEKLKNDLAMSHASGKILSTIEEAIEYPLVHMEEEKEKEPKDLISSPVIRGCLLLSMIVLVIGSIIGLTSKPSTAKLTERKERALKFLSVVSDPTALTTDGTPQALAAEWIANTDDVYVVPKSPYSANAHRFIQRYVLAVLWYSMGGKDWPQQLNFLSEKRECAWAQVFPVGRRNYQVGVSCEGDKVTKLFMPGMKMTGRLPAEVGWLSNLNHLSLYDNQITGPLPYALKDLTALKFLAIQKNQISGEIPEWIGELSNLHDLGLNDNNLKGALPESISDLTNLHELALGHNKLIGDIAVLEPLTELRGLFLEGNVFSAKFHHETLANLQKLEYLDLSGNKFQGRLRDHFLNFKELKYLEIANNTLTGTFPQYIEENTALKYLTVTGNEIEGTIPEALSNLKSLEHLDMGSNDFTGSMPTFFGSMNRLKYLLLDDNHFEEGPIPSSLQNLSSLHALSLENTGRTGPLEDWIGYNLGRVRYLNLARNELTGTVPKIFGEGLHWVELLLLQQNDLSGTLPDMKRLSNLEMLLIDRNSIEGSVEDRVCNGDDMALESLEQFVSDCTGNDPEVICPCCTQCCHDEDKLCIDYVWVENIDGHWEDYTEDARVFSEQIEFQVQSTTRKSP